MKSFSAIKFRKIKRFSSILYLRVELAWEHLITEKPQLHYFLDTLFLLFIYLARKNFFLLSRVKVEHMEEIFAIFFLGRPMGRETRQ